MHELVDYCIRTDACLCSPVRLANAHCLQHWVLHRVIRSQRTVHGIAIIADVDDLLRINRNFDVTRAFGLGNHGDELLLGCYPAPNGNNVGGSFALMYPSI